ncbi:hypothetical protein [Persicobacter psychrovividus]|uniref:Uncharacterized protein n=1 Tax=Persicobacter psychrovividus TaxID=387638 RepID=A0ABM7VKN5_9BACT|nr:hypothetical protein PEPS_38430 [Persicobacter psychrovividus]
MASRRDLKKVVHYLSNEFIADALLYLMIEDKNDSEIEGLVEATINAEEEAIDQINNKGYEGSANKHFKQVRTSFVEKIDANYTKLVDMMK